MRAGMRGAMAQRRKKAGTAETQMSGIMPEGGEGMEEGEHRA